MEVETSVKRRHDIYEMLEQQRAAAQKRRWRVSGTLLGTGVTLVILGLISKRLCASGVFGHGSYGNVGTVVITPAIGAVLLALLPTDTRTIRSLVDLSLVLMLTIGVMGMPTVFSAVINREHVSGYELLTCDQGTARCAAFFVHTASYFSGGFALLSWYMPSMLCVKRGHPRNFLALISSQISDFRRSRGARAWVLLLPFPYWMPSYWYCILSKYRIISALYHIGTVSYRSVLYLPSHPIPSHPILPHPRLDGVPGFYKLPARQVLGKLWRVVQFGAFIQGLPWLLTAGPTAGCDD